MDRLSRDINSLENSVARYIYIKYIQEQMPEHTPTSIIELHKEKDDGESSSSSEEEDGNGNETPESEHPIPKTGTGARTDAMLAAGTEEKSKKKRPRPKVNDKLAFAMYRRNIFHHPRSCFSLNQEDLIREDLQLMALADTAYEEHPDDFKVADYELPPDVMRCTFIRKHHHRYYRCRNGIMNKDSDVCKKHENSENIYYDNYNDLLDKII